ncbi:MAG: F0F1 ATP synthase subunit gamma [Gammaproteobacteria bacterium]|jgi:F-type H+-transporting ATPase subunit gamma|nr:F0F1 ATP synthase subunit gamma [Gammaproteobacteria bacterium]MEC9222979.1 F0F1 ATP synthase subunit gamma [Pseudomonadota bacterium]MEE2608340.1 F0F1 ATP synthase subunit gamma [Pseudomonadota bacterium]MEE3172023.1 F0F1 ATP synthase subunit gamma [Pseudomonadota bacterium]|tara:strand:- start:4888 stop:5748 length:861 start_codon:yes stop_codon:yes gene_type:complete
MAGGKEIRNKIASIENTQKITKAMEMVSASKMLKAQNRMKLGKPYAHRIRSVIGHIANSTPEYRHVYFDSRDIKRVGYIVVSTDRGLCGGLNINLFKTTVASMQEWADKNIEIDICTIGGRAATFFNNFGGNVVAAIRDIGESAEVADVIGAVRIMLEKFDNQEIDQLMIVTNDFINTMTYGPVVNQLLPLLPSEDEGLSHHWDYLYEPDAKELLDGLLLRFIESQVYQAVVENNACEQAARMLAMKNASDNAGDLIEELGLVYNKARQAAITQELSEIAGGAAAV